MGGRGRLHSKSTWLRNLNGHDTSDVTGSILHGFQTLFRLSHVLRVNLLSSVSGCQWQTCQFWLSMANANRAPRCWAVSTGPTRGRWALRPPSWSRFLIVWSVTFTPVACWRSFCRAVAVLILFLLAQRSRYWSCSWMNEWHIYIALYCVLLYTQSALQSCSGVSPQPPSVCSIHLDDATAATVQRHQCAHHTPATGGEERES